MKIISKKNCFTPSLSRRWKKGEVVEVDDKTAERLLKSKDFTSVRTEQLVAEESNKTNVSKYRKKGFVRNVD